MTKPSAEQLHAQYDEYYSRAVEFRDVGIRRLNELLEREGIALAFPIESRLKTWESISEKLGRVSLNLRSIDDLQDLVGFRIVVLFARDGARVRGLLERCLRVVKSYETRERLREDQFGYVSTHLVVQAPEDWFGPERADAIRSMKAEVQVRTLAQHLWAAASHSLQYKQAQAVPAEVRRAVHRVSALLETVDFEFERVLLQRDEYRSQPTVPPDAELNVDLLERVLDEFWPSANKGKKEPYGMVLRELNAAGVTTKRELLELLSRYRDQVLRESIEEARRIVHAVDTFGVKDGVVRYTNEGESGSMIGLTPEMIDKARRGIFYMHSGLTFTALHIHLGKHESRRPDHAW